MPAAAAVASIGGAIITSRASRKAAQTQEKSADRASEAELEMFYKAREDQLPWLQRGNAASNQLAYFLGLNVPGNEGVAQGGDFGSLLKNYSGADLKDDPGYQFRLDEGMKALQRAQSAGGRLLSGRGFKETARYGQDYASNEFGNAFARDSANKARTYNFLSGMSGGGQVAATSLGNQAINTGQQIGNNLIGAGNAAAAGQIGSANAWTSAIPSIFDLIKR
jgi:hypothetical protein